MKEEVWETVILPSGIEVKFLTALRTSEEAYDGMSELKKSSEEFTKAVSDIKKEIGL